jgi:hypothetical protein
MEFRTELHVNPSGLDLDYSSGMMMMGSCFAENIGHILQDHRLPVKFNSHGILFNPISIGSAMDDILSGKKYTLEDLRYFNGKYISMQHHGRFSSPDANETLKAINDSNKDFSDHLKVCKVLFITFGSAYAWRLKSNQKIVANCHKIPQSEFEKVLIEHTEIEVSYASLFSQIKKLNPGIQFVLSVSPVRYFRDGIIANNLSKSHLLIASHYLSKEKGVHYLPAYEWVVDDLRDYRFFKEDMVHPNDQAIQYVWEKFLGWSMKTDVINKIKKVSELCRALQHKAKLNDSIDEQARKEALLAKIDEIIRSN